MPDPNLYSDLFGTTWVASGLTVSAGSGLSVTVAPGVAFIPGSPQGPRQVLTQTVTLPVPKSSSLFIDWNGESLVVASGAQPDSGYARLASFTTNTTSVTGVTDGRVTTNPATSGGGTGGAQIAGDLGGTLATPTVTNLSHVTNASLGTTGLAAAAVTDAKVNDVAATKLTGTVPVGVLPVATTGALGVVKPDGTTVTIAGGVITASGSMPAAPAAKNAILPTNPSTVYGQILRNPTGTATWQGLAQLNIEDYITAMGASRSDVTIPLREAYCDLAHTPRINVSAGTNVVTDITGAGVPAAAITVGMILDVEHPTATFFESVVVTVVNTASGKVTTFTATYANSHTNAVLGMHHPDGSTLPLADVSARGGTVYVPNITYTLTGQMCWPNANDGWLAAGSSTALTGGGGPQSVSVTGPMPSGSVQAGQKIVLDWQNPALAEAVTVSASPAPTVVSGNVTAFTCSPVNSHSGTYSLQWGYAACNGPNFRLIGEGMDHGLGANGQGGSKLTSAYQQALAANTTVIQMPQRTQSRTTQASDAKFVHLGRGFFEIAHISLGSQTVGDTTPILFWTNPTVNFHNIGLFASFTDAVQGGLNTTFRSAMHLGKAPKIDGMICGGLGETYGGDKASYSYGYGSVVERNSYGCLRRPLVIQSASESSCHWRYNWTQSNCGNLTTLYGPQVESAPGPYLSSIDGSLPPNTSWNTFAENYLETNGSGCGFHSRQFAGVGFFMNNQVLDNQTQPTPKRTVAPATTLLSPSAAVQATTDSAHVVVNLGEGTQWVAGQILTASNVIVPAAVAVSNATWSGGVGTITTATNVFAVGTLVTISGVTATGASGGSYNGTFTVASVISGTQFTIAIASNAGTWSSGGTAIANAQVASVTGNSPAGFDSIFIRDATVTPTGTVAASQYLAGAGTVRLNQYIRPGSVVTLDGATTTAYENVTLATTGGLNTDGTTFYSLKSAITSYSGTNFSITLGTVAQGAISNIKPGMRMCILDTNFNDGYMTVRAVDTAGGILYFDRNAPNTITPNNTMTIIGGPCSYVLTTTATSQNPGSAVLTNAHAQSILAQQGSIVYDQYIPRLEETPGVIMTVINAGQPEPHQVIDYTGLGGTTTMTSIASAGASSIKVNGGTIPAALLAVTGVGNGLFLCLQDQVTYTGGYGTATQPYGHAQEIVWCQTAPTTADSGATYTVTFSGAGSEGFNGLQYNYAIGSQVLVGPFQHTVLVPNTTTGLISSWVATTGPNNGLTINLNGTDGNNFTVGQYIYLEHRGTGYLRKIQSKTSGTLVVDQAILFNALPIPPGPLVVQVSGGGFTNYHDAVSGNVALPGVAVLYDANCKNNTVITTTDQGKFPAVWDPSGQSTVISSGQSTRTKFAAAIDGSANGVMTKVVTDKVNANDYAFESSTNGQSVVPDGAMLGDSTGNRFWMRVGNIFRGIPLENYGRFQSVFSTGTAFAVGAALGTGSPTVASSSGNDSAGSISFTPGTSPTTGICCTVTFDKPYLNTPHVVISPSNTNAATNAPQFYVSGRGTNGFNISCVVAPTAIAYTFEYFVIGG